MVKTPWQKLIETPIDWDALALSMQRGRPSREELERRRKVRAAKAKARARVVFLRKLEERKAANRKLRRPRWPARLYAVMQPGCWYTRRDLIRGTGAPPWSMNKMLHRQMDQGKLERARNPDYDEAANLHPKRVDFWLYRMTAKGEARKAELARVGRGAIVNGCCKWPALGLENGKAAG